MLDTNRAGGFTPAPCAICGEIITSAFGFNNAEPVQVGYCCGSCNVEVVIPARLGQIVPRKRDSGGEK